MSLRTLIATGAILCSAGSALAVPAGLNLGPVTFYDEFEGTQLDLTKWSYRGAGQRLDGYVNLDPTETAKVENGVLKMKIFTTDGVGGVKIHNNGMISTSQARDLQQERLPDGLPQLPSTIFPGVLPDDYVGFEQRYGYFESRVRFHETTGSWSAFWVQSDTIGNPVGNPQVAGVEMDIFEHRVFNPFDDQFGEPYDVASKIHMGLIWDGYPSPAGSNAATHNRSPGPYPSDIPGLVNNDPAGTWHTAGLLWSPEGYKFYFDDQLIWAPENIPVSMRTQYIILSTEIWAQFAGQIPPLGYGTKENTTTFTEYDYVKVYAIPEPAGLGAVVVALVMLSRRK